jgi:hypothetical protein
LCNVPLWYHARNVFVLPDPAETFPGTTAGADFFGTDPDDRAHPGKHPSAT